MKNLNAIVLSLGLILGASANAGVKSDCEYKAVAKAMSFGLSKYYSYKFDSLVTAVPSFNSLELQQIEDPKDQNGIYATIVDLKLLYAHYEADGTQSNLLIQISVPHNDNDGKRCFIGMPTDVTNGTHGE